MEKEQLKKLAIEKTISMCAEIGIKVRRSFFVLETYIDYMKVLRSANVKILKVDGKEVVSVFIDFKNLPQAKTHKDKFLEFYNCTVINEGVIFKFTEEALEISEKVEVTDQNIEAVIRKINKLLALSQDKCNENEAIGASLMAQKLLAKYNIALSDLDGYKEEEQEAEEVRAVVGMGDKWKYELAEVIARSYRCKVYTCGSEVVVFYGFRQDILIARKVYMYLYNVCKRLGREYLKEYTENNPYEKADGIHTSYCHGFVTGVDEQLSKQCTELMIITPRKVEESFAEFSKGFRNRSLSYSYADSKAYSEGKKSGRSSINAQYIERKE